MKVSLICSHCGVGFEAWPSRLMHGRGRHCSRRCQYAASAYRDRNSIVLTCTGCSKEFRLPRSKIDRPGGGKYCTRACRDAHWVGAQTPNYQGGSTSDRGPHWAKIKRAIRARDGCCTVCGKSDLLHVHHVVPFRMFERHEDANRPDNLVTLCDAHHRQVEARNKWAKAGDSIIRMNAGGAAWMLAKERGLV